jgi:hypothetical protein
MVKTCDKSTYCFSMDNGRRGEERRGEGGGEVYISDRSILFFECCLLDCSISGTIISRLLDYCIRKYYRYYNQTEVSGHERA